MSNGTTLTDITGIEVTRCEPGRAEGSAVRHRIHVSDVGGAGAQRAAAFQRSRRMHESLARSIALSRWLDAIGANSDAAKLAALDAREQRLADPAPLTQSEREWINATPPRRQRDRN